MLANHPNVLGGGGVATNIIGGTGLFADGTAAAPSISFASNTDTGFYRFSANSIGIAAGGVTSLVVGTSGAIYNSVQTCSIQLNSAGAVSASAGGNNQNITLTPSGTGRVDVANGQLTLTNGNSQILSTGNIYFDAGGGGNLILRTGKTLIGTTVDSGALLQLSTNALATTSAYGITFGTDVNFYRDGAGTVAINHAGGTRPELHFRESGTRKASIFTSEANLFLDTDTAVSMFFRPGGTTALTLDASQNATFAGTAITLASAAAKAGLRIPHGAAPTSPTNGDMWTTTAGLYVRINGATVGPLS